MSENIHVRGNTLTFMGKEYRCAIGKNGITSDKKEGDGCTPVGTFALRECWWRDDREPAPTIAVPLRLITANDGWCDDPNHPDYNKPVQLPFDASHEKMKRDDHVYDYVIVLGYNDDPVVPGKGSAIFMHLAHDDYRGTEGCIALKKEDLLEILSRCDESTEIEIEP